MNTEEKAKAYDEALKRARKELQTCGSTDCDAARQIYRFFPELKESEDVDKKIREEIIATIHLYYGKPLEDEAKEMIAWLEKQEGCECIKKDWLEHIKQSWYKEGFIDGKYSDGTSKEWTKNDAATLKELIDFLENGTAKLQHDLTRYANWLKIQLTPIKKQGEPTDINPSKFDLRLNKLLKQFETLPKEELANSLSFYLNVVQNDGTYKPDEKQGEQKPAEWKQENVEELSDFENAMMHIGGSFFGENAGLDPNDTSAIKRQANLLLELVPKTEWSKEDETKMRAALAFIKSEFPKKGNEEIMEDTIAWLKSLKPQNTWKPSKEQIEALHDLNLTGDISHMGQARLLIELYNDLKKLKE